MPLSLYRVALFHNSTKVFFGLCFMISPLAEAWFHKKPSGCINGQACKRCHLCPEGEPKLRKKQLHGLNRSVPSGGGDSSVCAFVSSGKAHKKYTEHQFAFLAFFAGAGVVVCWLLCAHSIGLHCSQCFNTSSMSLTTTGSSSKQLRADS